MIGRAQLPISAGPGLSDGLCSNEIKKKIKRGFFKEDVAVKSYKCDVIGQDIATSAKLYISNRAFYVVHRPKRRKLTTMPFTEINHIKARSDEQGVDVYLTNESVYTFTRFQRPESAVAFLLNFWNMIRKEKFLSRHSQLSSKADLSSSSGNTQSNSANSTTPESLRIPKFPTTISLNSSASISESDSADSRRRDLNSISSEHLHAHSATEAVPGEEHALHLSRSSEDVMHSESRRVRTADPSVLQTGQFHSENNTTHDASKLGRKNDNHSFHPSIPSVEDHNNDSPSISEMKSPNLPHSASAPTARQLHGLSRPACSLKPKPNHQCLTETPGWSLWPLSFLPYPFAPPQRLTMIIAYAILGFLLFSTMHLYHRLAVFDLQGSPFVRSRGYADTASTMRSTLQSLEQQLAELVELTGQLAQSLMHMTGEIRGIRLESDPSSPATVSAPVGSSSAPPPETGPPV